MSFLNSFVVVVIVVVVAFVNDVLLVGILLFFSAFFLASIVAEVAAPPPPLRRELSICVFYCFYCLPMIELDERISVSGVYAVDGIFIWFNQNLQKCINNSRTSTAYKVGIVHSCAFYSHCLLQFPYTNYSIYIIYMYIYIYYRDLFFVYILNCGGPNVCQKCQLKCESL